MKIGPTLARLVGMAAFRPRLAWALLRTGWRFRSRDWYRRAPFLPVPPADYMAWRRETAWGDPDHVPQPVELERYLAWVLAMKPAKGR